MMAWKTQRTTKPPTLITASDIQMLGGGKGCAGVEVVEVPDSLYAEIETRSPVSICFLFLAPK
jgi:hypothetical protein